MEIEVDLRKWKWHLLITSLLVALVFGFFNWRAKRWDQPWLRSDENYDIVSIRFDGVQYANPQFTILRDAFCSSFMANKVHGFSPNDLSSNDRSWPSPYAWVQLLGHMEPKDREANLRRMRADAAAAIQKTGLTNQWRLVLISRDGTVIDPY